METRLTVLVVDDDPRIRKTTRRVLEMGGFAVVEAADGAEAVEIVKANGTSYAGVVLDVVMPVMTGPEAFEVLRRDHPELPVLFVSGNPRDSLDLLLDLPRVEFIGKPYERDHLVGVARRLFE